MFLQINQRRNSTRYRKKFDHCRFFICDGRGKIIQERGNNTTHLLPCADRGLMHVVRVSTANVWQRSDTLCW